jgi:hypothetical protein
MNREISWNVSDSMFNEMLTIQQELSFPNMKDLITQAVQRYISDIRRESWLYAFKKLQQQVRHSGNFNQLGQSKNEIVDTLREQRKQIFMKISINEDIHGQKYY